MMKAQTVSQKFRKTDCPTCSGRGRVWYPGCGESDVECGNCYGDGFVSEGDWDDDWEDPRLDLDAEPLIPEKSEYLETWFEVVKKSLGLPSNVESEYLETWFEIVKESLGLPSNIKPKEK